MTPASRGAGVGISPPGLQPYGEGGLLAEGPRAGNARGPLIMTAQPSIDAAGSPLSAISPVATNRGAVRQAAG